MNIVKIIDTEKIITAESFSNLTQIEKENYRGNMICTECNGNAWFGKSSVAGRIGHFKAKHIGECDMSSKQNDTVKVDGNLTEPMLKTSSTNFKIAEKNYFSNFWDTDGEVTDGEPTYKNYKAPNRVHVNLPLKSTQSKKTLFQLLNICKHEVLDEQDYFIEIDNKQIHVRNAIKSLGACNDSDIGKKKYYWGEILSANNIWLNADNNILLGKSLLIEPFADLFWKCLNINAHDWKQPIDYIVLGTLMKSQSEKLYVKVDKIENLYIDKCKFKTLYRK